jgi:phospholipid/cholesterol/gamma-HCH transport system permease protein
MRSAHQQKPLTRCSYIFDGPNAVRKGCSVSELFETAGEVSLFGFRALAGLFSRPFEGQQLRRALADIGAKSLPLIVASGFALGAVLTLHTRSTLVTFGATAWIPSVQALAFFLEIGPLVTALLVAGRVGSGIGAVLSNMRATEQIDAIESRSIDSLK